MRRTDVLKAREILRLKNEFGFSIKEITQQLCGTEFSKSTVSALCMGLDPIVAEFRNRPLDKSYPFVIVDALYTRARENNKVRNKGLMIAIGINTD